MYLLSKYGVRGEEGRGGGREGKEIGVWPSDISVRSDIQTFLKYCLKGQLKTFIRPS
jgi:hypothetical protein